MSNSDRFLEAFNSIERHLRKISKSKITKTRRHPSFYALVDAASASNPAVRRSKVDLKEFADLRNAIVHERTDGHVIAEPNDQAVKEIEHIASLLLKPPRVIPRFQTEVFTLSVSDPVAMAVRCVFDRSFSQIPIYDAREFVGLLTTNTVARWLGACVKDDVFSLAETPITLVLDYTEDQDNHTFLSRSATLFEVLERFQYYETRGKRLEAILITHNGRRAEFVLGIITTWDLPKIYETL